MDGVWDHLAEVVEGPDLWARLTMLSAAHADHDEHEPPPAVPLAPRCARCGAYCQACTRVPVGWPELPADVRDHLDVGDAVQPGQDRGPRWFRVVRVMAVHSIVLTLRHDRLGQPRRRR